MRYYRRPRTTQERRKSLECEAKYVRPARNYSNLPNSWDDISIHHDKSWKSRRKTQYREGKRGKEHTIEVSEKSWYRYYALKEYFGKHNIPYQMEEIKEKYVYRRELTKWLELYRRPRYQLKYSWVTGTDGKRTLQRVRGRQIGWETVGEHVPTGEYRTYQSSRTIGYRITWWSDKDIGIEYIMNSIHL